MRALHEALMEFWGGFGVPVFVAGHVPDGQAFPYITIEIVQGDAFSSTVLTAFNWHKYDPAAEHVGLTMASRADLMDEIARAIPAQGTRLPVAGGFCVLSRNEADFQTYYDDPEDETVLGGRTSYEIRFYTL